MMTNTGSTKIHEHSSDSLRRVMHAESRFMAVQGIAAYCVMREEKEEPPKEIPEELHGMFRVMMCERTVIFFAFVTERRLWSPKWWATRWVMRRGRIGKMRHVVPCPSEESALEQAMRYYTQGTVAGDDNMAQRMKDRASVEMLTRGPQ